MALSLVVLRTPETNLAVKGNEPLNDMHIMDKFNLPIDVQEAYAGEA